jgi:hypothetical protein
MEVKNNINDKDDEFPSGYAVEGYLNEKYKMIEENEYRYRVSNLGRPWRVCTIDCEPGLFSPGDHDNISGIGYELCVFSDSDLLKPLPSRGFVTIQTLLGSVINSTAYYTYRRIYYQQVLYKQVDDTHIDIYFELYGHPNNVGGEVILKPYGFMPAIKYYTENIYQELRTNLNLL